MPRKSPGESWEAYADRQVREAQERGAFDGLRGLGEPLDLGRRRDPDWWIRRKLKDEEFVVVPPALQLRRDVDEARARIAAATTEVEVRAVLDAINTRIRHANATIVSGPPSNVWPLDEARVLARWRAEHPPVDPPPVEPEDAVSESSARWWRRLLGRPARRRAG